MSIVAEFGQYILQTQFKKIQKIQWGREFERPLWVRRWAYLAKATARVDSRLKLLVNSSVSQLITCDKLTI